jgi:hypothetical protein
VEDFKFLSSFQPGGDAGTAAESPAGGPASLEAPEAPPPPADAEPVPYAVAFPPEAVWNASGGEAEAAGSDLLCFTIANEEFAIDIQRVWEIIRPRRVTEIPGVPEFISGIIALRGEIVPVLDLRRRLGFPPVGTAQASAKIIVAVHDGRRIGMGSTRCRLYSRARGPGAQPNALIGGQSQASSRACAAAGTSHRDPELRRRARIRIGGEGTPEIPRRAGARGAGGTGEGTDGEERDAR